jgi:hypothetical protein
VTKVSAPIGEKKVRLLAPNEPAAKDEHRVWYALWGLVPIKENDIADIYASKPIEGMRVETKFTPLDIIISFFTGIASIQCKTIEVYYTTETRRSRR